LKGIVLVDVRVDAKERPAISDIGLKCRSLQAPRVAYLLVPEIQRFLIDVISDDEGARALREEDLWFEGENHGLLKWYVENNILLQWATRRETAENRKVAHLSLK
jgi:autophagy-related protein 5